MKLEYEKRKTLLSKIQKVVNEEKIDEMCKIPDYMIAHVMVDSLNYISSFKDWYDAKLDGRVLET